MRSLLLVLVLLVLALPLDSMSQDRYVHSRSTPSVKHIDGAITGTSLSFFKIEQGTIGTDRIDSRGVSWVDADGDGDADVFVSNNRNTPNRLFVNNGDGTFTSAGNSDLVTDAVSSNGNCWADYDNDGDLDAFVAGNPSRLYENEGQGTFTRKTNLDIFGINDLRGWACAWADYDNDRFVDLLITHPSGFVGNPLLTNFLFRNRGDGTFERITSTPITDGLAPYTVGSWSDYDLDGDQDLFIGAGPASNSPGPDFLYHNELAETGSATFRRITTEPLATKNRDGQVFNWIDIDNDGDLDVFITNWGGGLGGGLQDELYRNDDGTFTRLIGQQLVTLNAVSLASVWADFDNDGDLDVFIADGSSNQPNRLYLNNGDGTFTRDTTGPLISDRATSWGAAAADYDDDGDLDLYVANTGGSTRNFFYRNDLISTNSWLKVKLIGTASNRAGIGARLRVRASINGQPVWQQRELSSQNSFNGHNSFTLHVGLGDATVVDSVEVTWPSGLVDVYRFVTPNQTLTLTEGEAPVANEHLAAELPSEVVLHPNYPNPFNPTTTLAFSLPHPAYVTLRVYDLWGREVATLRQAPHPAGTHQVSFNASRLPSGLYIAHLRAGTVHQTRPLMLVQ